MAHQLSSSKVIPNHWRSVLFQTLESISIAAFEHFKQDEIFGPLIDAMNHQVWLFGQCREENAQSETNVAGKKRRLKEPQAVIAELKSALEFELKCEKDKAKVADDFPFDGVASCPPLDSIPVSRSTQ